MAGNLHGVSFIFFFLSLQIGCAVRIEITPDETTEIENVAVNISCLPEVQINVVQKVLVLEISKTGERPIAIAKLNSKISFGKDKQKVFGAQFQVVDNPEDSYLNLTLPSPKMKDTGTYTCAMYYIDETGMVSHEMDSENLTVKEYDASALVSIVGKQREMLSDLNAKVDLLHQKISTQEQTIANISNLEHKLANLTESVTCQSAFSATTTKHTDPHNGDVVQFPKVLLKVGQGYDESTSIFTAPMNGLYAFILIITIDCSECFYYIDLKVNSKVIATLLVGETVYYSQSSISTLAKLNRSDKVKAVTKDDHGSNIGDDETVLFNGFLINCF